MRRRKRNKSIIFILILFISIGFAALTANLSINSGITFLPQSFNVYFANISLNQNSVNKNNPTLSSSKKNITFTTSINEPGDFYEFSFDVVNDGTMDAAISEIVKSSLTETQEKYLTYTTRYYGEREIKVDDILHAGYKERVVVRVEYKYDVDEVVSLGNITFNFGLNYIKRDLQKDYGEETWAYWNTNSEKTLTVPKTGLYKLETWGSQGRSIWTTAGYGGYATGTINLTKNNKLHIAVGDQYAFNEDDTTYNGGGQYYNGGGATHIALGSTNRGQLFNYENNIDELLLVSGGGGGAERTVGGSGGGYIGGVGTPATITGGTQTSGGKGSGTVEARNGRFGIGGSGIAGDTDGAGGGGGGFYGGGGITWAGGGGGGSGYIGNTNLTNKVMYCYNCQSSENEADETHIKTRSTTNVSKEPISYYAKEGVGFARITYLGKYNTDQYTVINYHPNGGQGSMNTQVINSNTSLKENKYTREGYTFVGWSTTEKELPNLITTITTNPNFTEYSPGEYTFDYSKNTTDTYLRTFFSEDIISGTNYTLLFNVKNLTRPNVIIFSYPKVTYNEIYLKNGLNKRKFSTWENTEPKSMGIFDDIGNDGLSTGTIYNFFLYKDSEVDYLDKANITYNSNTRTINLYALWAKVES